MARHFVGCCLLGIVLIGFIGCAAEVPSDEIRLIPMKDFFKDPEKSRSIIEALQAQVDIMKESVDAGELAKLVETDYIFHTIIVKSTENSLFYSIYKTLRSFMYEEILQSQNDYEDPALIVAEHQNIVETIKSGEINRSVKTFNSHIENIENRLNITDKPPVS